MSNGERKSPGGIGRSGPLRRWLASPHLNLNALLVVGAACLCVATLSATAARGQGTGPANQAAPVAGISLGERGWSAPERRTAPDGGKNQLEFEFRGGLASDYIYRGVTLSDRKPAVGTAIEAT